MKRIMIYMVLIILSAGLFSQTNIDGCYEMVDDNGEYWGQFISIKDGIFHIHYATGWAALYDYECYDSLALGTYQWVTPDFVEINSFPVKQSLYDKMVFHTYNDPSLHQDSLYIGIRIPYKGDTELDIYSESNCIKDMRYTTIICKNGRATAVFARECFSDIRMVFVPLLNGRDFSIGCKINQTGSFLGTVYTSLGPFPVPEDANVAEFEFPNMDLCMFVRHNIRGEYVKVEHNKLIWRGYTYKKVRKCK